MALSLYRKYRPNVFSDVVGQEHVEKTLVNAVIEGTVAHAYLFCGPRAAPARPPRRACWPRRCCARRVPNARARTAPAQQCQQIARRRPSRRQRARRSQPHRRRERARRDYRPRAASLQTRGRYKIYIIDEVHMLSVGGVQRAAQDAGGAARPRRVHTVHHRPAEGA